MVRICSLALRALALLALPAFASCVDEEIVYRDRELFETPPTEAMGFLGYTDRAAKLTVCGNCHVGEQKRWVAHAHSGAWGDLGATGQGQAGCVACHTVNQNGNATTAAAGFLAFANERYQDVQCESCHGPGLAHVQNPDLDANHPIASVAVGTDLTAGCGECHRSQHHPFVQEWASSGHGRVNTVAAPRTGCNACHEAKGILAAFGVNNVYVEKTSTQLLPITCAVCHDPHGNNNAGNLRFPIDSPALEQNLCAKCHNRRAIPDPTSTQGLHPHAPEGALLFGEAGWFPPGSTIEPGKIIASHGGEGNPRLCATCHVRSFTVTDQGATVGTSGHTFQAIPCRGANGLPVATDCDMTTTARDFTGCTGARCHATPQAAFSAVTSATTDLRTSAEELLALLRQVDPNLDAAGGQIDPANPTFTVAEGALYNYYLATFGGTGRPSPLLTYAGSAVHNPFLMRSLLAASRQVVRSTYGLTSSAGDQGRR